MVASADFNCVLYTSMGRIVVFWNKTCVGLFYTGQMIIVICTIGFNRQTMFSFGYIIWHCDL